MNSDQKCLLGMALFFVIQALFLIKFLPPYVYRNIKLTKKQMKNRVKMMYIVGIAELFFVVCLILIVVFWNYLEG